MSNNSKFNDLINSEIPVVIDFYADWCGPCKAMGPILHDVKSRVGDNAKIVKINVDKNRDIAMQLGIQSIPTLMIFKNGEMKWKNVGVSMAKEIENALSHI